MLETVIDWDGTHLPGELRELPPGRYVVTPIEEDEELTEEEEAGILAALDELDAGLGRDAEEVMEELRERIREHEDRHRAARPA
jgi:predicted transcriptional regulator